MSKEIENFELQPQHFKFSLEIKKDKIECLKGFLNKLNIKHSIKDNKDYPNMVTLNALCTLLEVYWIGYYCNECNHILKDSQKQ